MGRGRRSSGLVRMDRHSPEASKLRDAVSTKLLDFLGDYSDNVLTEYIVVLVCNGKDQNQARNELEVFLGDENEKFVSWLWNYLSEEIFASKALDPSSDLPDATSKHSDVNEKPEQNSRISNTVSVRHEAPVPPNSNALSTTSASDASPHLCMATLSSQIYIEGSQSTASQACTESVSIDDGYTREPNYASLLEGPCPGNTANGDNCLKFDSGYEKIQRCSETPCIVPAPRRGVKRISQISHIEDPNSTTSGAKVNDARRPSKNGPEPQDIRQSRGCVWDRLGKPCTEDDAMRENDVHCGTDASKRKKTEHDLLHECGFVRVVPGDNIQGTRMGKSVDCDKIHSNKHSQEFTIQNHMLRSSFGDAHNFREKGTYNSVVSKNCPLSFSLSNENCPQVKEAFKGLQEVSLVNCKDLQHCNQVISVDENPVLYSGGKYHHDKSESTDTRSQATKISLTQLNKDAQVTDVVGLLEINNTSRVELKCLKNIKCESDDRERTRGNLLAVMPPMLQTENSTSEICPSEVGKCSGTRHDASSGVPCWPGNDVDFRTVLVTNVHFGASKGALYSHFVKCGVVVKVDLLTDVNTGQPKGAAYIVFASKESVDKAISLSGTSLFSRVLTVKRKSEASPAFLMSARSSGKLLQTYSPQSHKGYLQRRHFQWRRSQAAGLGNVPSRQSSAHPSNTR